MAQIVTIGLDLAKNVFQVHGVDGAGAVILRRQLRRAEVLKFFASLPPCLVGMEACASAHHWGRELKALGHEVRLMPPAYVKPYVKRGKTDAADAEAICEAVTRPTMRFVAVKSADQQAALMLHKARELLVRQRVMLTNALRAHLAEYGLIAAQGPAGANALRAAFNDANMSIPAYACDAINALLAQIDEAGQRKSAFGVGLELFQRLALDAGKQPGDEPCRLAHLDNNDKGAILIKGRRRAVGRKMMRHGASPIPRRAPACHGLAHAP
jgi:transposase